MISLQSHAPLASISRGAWRARQPAKIRKAPSFAPLPVTLAVRVMKAPSGIGTAAVAIHPTAERRGPTDWTAAVAAVKLLTVLSVV